LRFNFEVEEDTPDSNLEIKLKLTTDAESNIKSHVLSGSIVENLSPYPGTVLNCSIAN